MQTIMENPTLIMQDNSVKFSNMLREKISKGFVIEERNDKLPFAVMSKKGVKVNHNISNMKGAETVSVPFADLCVTGGIVNAYNALKLAATYK